MGVPEPGSILPESLALLSMKIVFLSLLVLDPKRTPKMTPGSGVIEASLLVSPDGTKGAS